MGVARRAEELWEFTPPIKNHSDEVVNALSDKWYDWADKWHLWRKFHG